MNNKPYNEGRCIIIKKERVRNYEILRILAMLMIVCLHYLSKGGALANATEELMDSGYAAWLIEAFCLSAVNVYVLISGYFGIGDRDASDKTSKINVQDVLKRTFRIYLQVWFYSVVIGLIFILTWQQRFDIYTIFMYVFPFSTEHYWFATAYLLLTLFMPFLNAGFDRMEKRAIQGVLLCMLMAFSISKTILPMQLPWDHKGYDAFWFVFLYLAGAYIRRYGVKWITNRVKAIGLYVGSTCIIFMSMLLIKFLYHKTGSLEDFVSYGYSYNFFFTFLASVGLFLAFKPTERKQQKVCSPFLQTVSRATFGVYLIHEHVNLRYLWPTWFQSAQFATTSIFVFLLHMLVTVLVVYIVCSVIEIIRNRIIHGIIDKK